MQTTTTPAKRLTVGSYASISIAGRRPDNQDRFTRFHSAFGEIVLLADGIGGHKGGAQAAEIANQELPIELRKSDPALPVGEALREAVRHVNRTIYQLGYAGHAELAGMGTTIAIAALCFARGELYVINAGDSRVYIYRGGVLKLLTRDHTVASQLQDAGLISADQARDHPGGHVLTKSLGQTPELSLDPSEPVPLQPGDAILLCSDGLSAYLPGERIAQFLGGASNPDDAVRGMADAALDNGSKDNISIQLVSISEAEVVIGEGLQVGEYILQKPLGKGGMAEVWLGRHVVLKKKLAAVKILASGDPQLRARFLKEAQEQAGLHHPAIIQVWGYGEIKIAAKDANQEAVAAYLILEYIDGESLTARIERSRQKQISHDEFAAIATRVLDALEYVHQNGLVHRDVKPANILLDRQGNAYLGDFGIVLSGGEAAMADGDERQTNQRASDDRITVTNQAAPGTAHYMAPEQDYGKKVDYRADIYSAGCVFYEILSGLPPFWKFGVSVRAAHHNEPPKPFQEPASSLDGGPSELQRVILRALKKSPGERWQSCAEFRKAIKRSARFKRYRLAGTVAICALGLLTWPAMLLWDNNKTDNANLDVARQLADTSIQLVGSDRHGAVLTGLQSVRAHESVKGQESLLRGLTGLGNAGTLLARDVDVFALAFSSNGRWLAAAAEDVSRDALLERSFDTGHGDLRIWEVQTGRELFRLPNAGGSLAWSPDGGLVAVATQGERVAIWDVARAVTKKLDLAPLLLASDSPRGSKARGQALPLTDENLIVRLAEEDAHRGEIPRALDVETDHDSIVKLAWDPKGVYLAGLNEKGKTSHPEVLIWNAKTGRLVRAFPAPDIWSMNWIPGTDLLAFGTAEGNVETWNVNGERLGTTKAAATGISGIAFSPDANRFAVIEHQTVTVWAVENPPSKSPRSQPLILRVDKQSPVTFACEASGDHAIAWSPDGRQVACAEDASVKVLDVDHTPGRMVEEFEMAPSNVIPEPGMGAPLAWSPDGTKLAFPADGTLRLAEAFAPFVRTLVGRDGGVLGLSWIDGSRIFVANPDDQFRIWDSSRETSATAIQEAAEAGRFSSISGRLLYARVYALVMLNRDKTLAPRYFTPIPGAHHWLIGGSPDGRQLAWLAGAECKSGTLMTIESCSILIPMEWRVLSSGAPMENTWPRSPRMVYRFTPPLDICN